MMDAVRRKLTSRKGASLLLALLFLLICSMVSASILMAATSNAGKQHSNRQEHQNYLAISSAVNLLCTELTEAEYKGGYSCKQVTGEGGINTKTIIQADGTYTGKLASILKGDLDGLFGQEVKKYATEKGLTAEEIKSKTSLSHTLTIQPQTGTVLDEQAVTIQLKVVESSYAIELTAQLGDYRMQAELTPVTTRPTLPESLDFDVEETQYTKPLEWKIGWITTGEGEEGA